MKNKRGRVEIDSVSFRGRGWIRTTEGINQQIYSLPHLATLEHARRREFIPFDSAKLQLFFHTHKFNPFIQRKKVCRKGPTG